MDKSRRKSPKKVANGVSRKSPNKTDKEPLLIPFSTLDDEIDREHCYQINAPAQQPLPDTYGYDLKHVANGVWYFLHLAGAMGDVTTLKGMASLITKNFVCEECQEHFIQFLTANPIPSDPKMAYDWTIRCHNNANRLNKVPPFTNAADLKEHLTPCTKTFEPRTYL